ncbi:GNAT family N-acetyltransferase [Paracoccus sp. p3-h83]|uniref:GNAT family N-acetyltransferase n=1 Tax=Paracoccus sp. p3-h83 TaxID=3342805 RepID=UPI0035B7FDBE
MTAIITRESPLTDDLALLFQRHHDHCHADTPPESIHMMDRADLAVPEIAFFVARDDEGQPLAMGAVKVIEPGHGELKSMHVLAEARGLGLARQMLDHLIAQGRAMGLTRLSLETGAQASFTPARALYAAAGFAECGPFLGYRADPMSVFMTLDFTMPSNGVN